MCHLGGGASDYVQLSQIHLWKLGKGGDVDGALRKIRGRVGGGLWDLNRHLPQVLIADQHSGFVNALIMQTNPTKTIRALWPWRAEDKGHPCSNSSQRDFSLQFK